MDADELPRGRRATSPPTTPSTAILRAFLLLPARQARALLPAPPEDAPLEGSILGVLLLAGLRRARDAPPLAGAPAAGEGHLDLPTRADGDEAAPLQLLRVALARVRAHHAAIQAPKTPDECLGEMDVMILNALLHRTRRVTSPPPSEVCLLRLLLRLPAHQARRLVPPPVESARQRRRADPGSTEPTFPAILLCAGLRRLEANLPPGSDGLIRDFVQVIRPWSLRLLPPPSEGDHAITLLPPPPVEQPERSGLLSAALGLIGPALAWRHPHRHELPPPPGAGAGAVDEDMVLVMVGIALKRLRFHTGRVIEDEPRPAAADAVGDQRIQLVLLSSMLHCATRLGLPPWGTTLIRLFLRLPAQQARRVLPPPADAAEPAHPGLTFVPVLFYAGLRRCVHREDNGVVLLLVRVALQRIRGAGAELLEIDGQDKAV